MTQVTELLSLCASCANGIYTMTPPNAQYAGRITRMLLGTALAETALRTDRQTGFTLNNPAGGWSWWQLECVSVQDSLNRLMRKPQAEAACAAWLFNRHDTEITLNTIRTMGELGRMNLIREWPRLAVLFARLHYIWVPAPIPDGIYEQAEYWMLRYNCGGKGTIKHYVDNWRALSPVQ